MKPRPLHRSLSFWSGVFTMISIYWASWDSIKNISYAIYGPYGAYSQVKVLSIDNIFSHRLREIGREPDPPDRAFT